VTADPTQTADPTSVRVPEGATVFDSGNIEGGDEFTYVFEVAGEYTYVCKLHEAEGMRGTILVVAADADAGGDEGDGETGDVDPGGG
jgi:plastocyanin